MGHENSKKKLGTPVGWFYFWMFAALIVSGIVVKRAFGHPELMMLFHLPAAVFLVLAGYQFTSQNRARYFRGHNTD